MLDILCPMHVVLNATGHIIHAGPTIHKVCAGMPLIGQRFLEWAELRRPRIDPDMQSLRETEGVKLHLKLRAVPGADLKGVLVIPDARHHLCPPGGVVINLSFGYALIDAVQMFDLNAADFAPTDLAIEMLYLVEAKSTAMEASRKMALRLQGAKIAAEEQAFTDTLTGLKNRRALEHVFARLVDAGTPFALMHCDLDHFKAVNDTLGHAAGDFVLQRVARIMVDETRAQDMIVRIGGDEFVLILQGLEDVAQIEQLAARLIAKLEKPMDYEGAACRISGSIGTTLSSYYAPPELDQMVEDADRALYAAKKAGRGRGLVFVPSQK